MRIAVVGVGGVGGYFGGRLAQAGAEVQFLARGATLQALRVHGLRVESTDGNFELPQVQATDTPAQIGPVDVVLVSVKATQVATLAPQLRPLVGPGTLVIPLQNGVEAADQLATALGWEHVLGGFCRIIAQQVAPGHILHTGVVPTIVFGPLNFGQGSAGPVEAVRTVLRSARIAVDEPTDMRRALWEKFLYVSPFGAVGAAARAPLGELLRVAETRAILTACVAEVIAVGKAHGVALPDALADGIFQLYQQTPATATSSMQRDLMAGRPSELDAQTGAVIRLGQLAGIATPVHNVLYAILRPQELAAQASG